MNRKDEDGAKFLKKKKKLERKNEDTEVGNKNQPSDEAKPPKKKKKKKLEKRNEDTQEKNQHSEKGDNQDAANNSKKKLKKKKKKLKEEKRDNNEKPPQLQKPVKSPKKKTEVTSDSSQDEDRTTSKEEKEDKNAGKHLTDWTMDEYRSLLDSLESSIKQPSPQHNKLPESVWEEVKVENHSPDVCRAAWTKICQVTKTHMSLQQMVDVARNLIEKNKNVIKILTGNKDPNFPNAPSVHRANSYNLYTKHRLEETPRPTFREIADGWKVLSEGDKQAFATEAEKLNKEAEKNLKRFLDTLPPERKQQFLSSQSQQKSTKKVVSEFDDAPRIHPANGYNIFTKANREEDPKISFKEIAEKWKQLSEGERKTYAEEAKKVNEQSRLEFETYRQNLTPEKQARFNKQFEKSIKRVSESKKTKTPKPKPPPKLKERELKKAEIQYMKEEKAEAEKENPDSDEDEVLLRLSEAFRSLPYKEQAEYLKKYEAEVNEQKKITEFYKSKHIDSPNPPKDKKSHSSAKAHKSEVSSVKIIREESDSSSSSDDSSDEQEVTAKKQSQASPKKTAPAKKSLLMSPGLKIQVNQRKSESSSSESDSESSDDDDKDKKKREMSPVLPVIKQSPSSPTKRQPSSSINKPASSPRKRKRSTSSSSSSSSSEEEEANTTVVKVKSPQKPSTPRKRKHSSSSSSGEEEGNKTVVKKSPKKTVSPRKKMFSSSVSEDETDDTSENDKKDKRGSLKFPTSSLKSLKKKKSKQNSA